MIFALDVSYLHLSKLFESWFRLFIKDFLKSKFYFLIIFLDNSRIFFFAIDFYIFFLLSNQFLITTSLLIKSFLKILLYIWNEIEFDTIIQLMNSSLLEKNYSSKLKFFQIFNDFIKCQNYAIIIIDNQKNVKEIMNKFVIRCNKNKKQRVSQIINKRSKVDIKRVDYFF